MRPVAVTTRAAAHLPIPQQLEAFRRNGFDSLMVWLDDRAEDILKRARTEGLSVVNCHADPHDANALWTHGADADAYEKYLTASLEAAAANGVPVLVVHLSKGAASPAFSASGADRLARVIGRAESLGVKMAFENLHKPELLFQVMALFSSPSVGFCFDVGHWNCWTPGEDFLGPLGDRLCTIHLHDNDGRCDGHWLPGDGQIDFAALARRLKVCGYGGPIGMETDSDTDVRYEALGTDRFLRQSASWGRSFSQVLEGE